MWGDVGRCGERVPLLGEPELDLEHRKVAKDLDVFGLVPQRAAVALDGLRGAASVNGRRRAVRCQDWMARLRAAVGAVLSHCRSLELCHDCLRYCRSCTESVSTESVELYWSVSTESLSTEY